MIKKLFKNKFSLIQLTSICLISFCQLFGERGDLVSAEILSTRNVVNAQSYIDQELAQIVSDIFAIDPAKYGYWMYKITYETINAHGEIDTASGFLSYPRVDWPDIPDQAFPVMSYQHGTVVQRSDVTSEQGEWILPAILSSSGYVYLEPDYLGLGVSAGMHPYQIKEPYGTVIVDLIRAVKYYARSVNNQFMVNDQLFLVGYSEGGYATMAAHQIIERDYNNELDVSISFPMAGAYSMSGVMTDLMIEQVPYGEPFYFPYVLFAYLDSYHDIGTAETYLLPEYLFLENWFDGFHSSIQINEVLPSAPINIMKPEEIYNFENIENHPLRVALKQNDLWNWKPESPVYIFHGLGDELIPFENAQMAYNQFIENGAQDIYLESIPESFGGHQDVAPWALFGAYEIAKQTQMINELGDINQDSSLDILDIVGIAILILDEGILVSEEYKFWASDLNLDSIINIQDIISLINIILYY